MEDVLIEVMTRHWSAVNACARLSQRMAEYVRTTKNVLAETHVILVKFDQGTYSYHALSLPNGVYHGRTMVWLHGATYEAHYEFGVARSCQEVCKHTTTDYILQSGVSYVYVNGLCTSAFMQFDSTKWSMTFIGRYAMTVTEWNGRHTDEAVVQISPIDDRVQMVKSAAWRQLLEHGSATTCLTIQSSLHRNTLDTLECILRGPHYVGRLAAPAHAPA